MTDAEPTSTSTSHIFVRPVNSSSQPDLPSRHVVSPFYIPVRPVNVEEASEDHRLAVSPTATKSSSGDTAHVVAQSASTSRSHSPGGDRGTPPRTEESTATWTPREETNYAVDDRPWSPKPPGYTIHQPAPTPANNESETTFANSLDDEPPDYVILACIITVCGNVVFGLMALLLSGNSQCPRLQSLHCVCRSPRVISKH